MDIVRLAPGQIERSPEPLALALGNFDGMHLGHRKLLFEAKLNSPGRFGVLLFDDSPLDFIDSQKEKGVLMTLSQKISYLSSFGCDAAYLLHSSKELFSLTPQGFIDTFLKPLSPSSLYVGEDYRFGKEAMGTPETLMEVFPTHLIPLLEKSGTKVSSSKVKELLKDGKAEAAASLLGHPFEMEGKVMKGEGLGHTIGFPTANLESSIGYAPLRPGVYAGISYSRGRPYVSITNVGKNPTVGKLRENRIETHFDGLKDRIYGETVYIGISIRLREEIRFPSLDELSKQLKKDLEEAHRRLEKE